MAKNQIIPTPKDHQIICQAQIEGMPKVHAAYPAFGSPNTKFPNIEPGPIAKNIQVTKSIPATGFDQRSTPLETLYS